MNDLIDFIHHLKYEDLPSSVVKQATYCLIDLLGVAASGHGTQLAKIMETFVSDQMPGQIPLLFSDHCASLSGACLFGASLIDSIDAHDGQVLTKGHVGVAILPALLATLSEQLNKGDELSGKELITSLIIGYEVATRAGIALHSTALDYHTSGAWNGLGVAAISARLMRLSHQQTYEALGIAEFHGPRSQMMRCIDYPTMVKDGSGWGALAGITSSLLDKANFTGAPAITMDANTLSNDAEKTAIVHRTWQDIGQRWYIQEQYFKAYPVCRWAQPAIESIRQIQKNNPLDYTQINRIKVVTFHQAKRLHITQPQNTEQAQYSLPFSVASALIDGEVSVDSIGETQAGLFHPKRIALSQKVKIEELDEYNALFPAERWAHAIITLANGKELQSSACIARGNPENPLTEDEILDKFYRLTKQSIKPSRQASIIEMCQSMADLNPKKLYEFLQLLKPE